MKRFGRISLFVTLVLLAASCDNAEMLAVRSDDFMPPASIFGSDWTSSIDNGFVELSFNGTLTGGASEVKVTFAEIRVSTEYDMKTILTSAKASVVGSTVSAKIKFKSDGTSRYYAQVVCGRAENYGTLCSEVFVCNYMLPEILSTEVYDISWFGCKMEWSVNTHGQTIKTQGIIYSCNPNNMTLETANRKMAVSSSVNSTSQRLSVDNAAEDAGLDKANAPLYYIRAYAVTDSGTGYGPIKQFRTYKWPGISGIRISDIYFSSATLEYTLSKYSGDPSNITEKVMFGGNDSTSGAKIVVGHEMSPLVAGTTYYCRYYFSNQFGENIYKTVAIPFTTIGQSPKEAVDLGLPSGLKWATCNVGANKPEGYGSYFAWGETFSKTEFTWGTYAWCNGTSTTITKYNTNFSYGTVDNMTELQTTDDAARRLWGGTWRMPTEDEMIELHSNCTWTWETKNGVNGYTVKGPNNNTIFLPAAGYGYGTSVYGAGSEGHYWSSTLGATNQDGAWGRFFTSSIIAASGIRNEGYPVRPVTN